MSPSCPAGSLPSPGKAHSALLKDEAGSCVALEHWDALPISTVRSEQGHQHGEPLPIPLPKGLVQSPAARNSEQQLVKALPSATESPSMMQSILAYRKKEIPVTFAMAS